MIKIMPINKSPLLSSTLNPPFLFLAPGEHPVLSSIDELIKICPYHCRSPTFSYGNLSFTINSLIFPFSITTNSVTSSGKFLNHCPSSNNPLNFSLTIGQHCTFEKPYSHLSLQSSLQYSSCSHS